jgi:rhamnosyltransferase
MSAPAIDVIVRCRNEMPYAERALDALARQRGRRARVLWLDCGSTDGSREAAVRAGVCVRDIDPSAYVPGRVLNQGMRWSESALVAFVNADAVALDEDALDRLARALESDPSCAAAYGRQLARSSAAAITRRDYARAFGDAPAVVSRGTFFSMAASIVRRSAWELLPFDESLRYSEDVDWTRRVTSLGWSVTYVPEARFEHSHDYDLAAAVKRFRGEGAADAAIHRAGPPSVWADLVRPLAGALLRDARVGGLTPSAIAQRVAERGGYFLGRRECTR